MNEKPLVSVIINCYNSEKYLRETIDSLVSQTYDNWEAIFWDNCSTDKTAEIIESYGDIRFRYFLAEKNSPLGEARNLAMEKAQGQYLCFLDSDDVWVKEFLEVGLKSLIGRLGVVGFYSNCFIRKNGQDTPYDLIKSSGVHSLKDVLHLGYGVGMSGCIVDLVVIKTNSIQFDNRFSLIEDFDFFVKVLRFGPFAYTSAPLFFYRVYDNNNSHKQKERWEEEYTLCYEVLKSEYVNAIPPILELSDIQYVRDRLLMAKIDSFIERNERLEVLKILASNRGLSAAFWRRLVFVLFGREIWYKLKGER